MADVYNEADNLRVHNDKEFLDQVNKYELRQKYSALWSYTRFSQLYGFLNPILFVIGRGG
jgi:hypothetical protein